jgi:hypothetical protein
LTEILEVGSAFEAALAEALAAGWSVGAGVEEVVLGAAGVEESFMENKP